ncbi:MAG TPA: AAA family ATPase [Actinocrinis sp.]|jgi:DNA helicase IV|uniref:HelD family protein n=1 Tax=Actinocrinis sp. TaxID=1920516 RepID=UPI002DDCD348|nr:AAA family ATPase [Actinocrinis sp.]HEV3169686.1 AAA family ATPase [Actinocrinis sp.]
MPSSADDPTILAERAHLSASRSALRAMREDTLALKAQGGNAVSTEVLQAAIAARAAALLDRPDVPLFFGRLDYSPDLDGAYRGERYYVGRRHVHDAAGDPMVIDWRALVSVAFYRASAKDPHGLALRRRFGFSGGDLTAYEDEPLDAAAAGRDAASSPSRILAEEIERPRVGPMRDIVATIQPDQDEIVRADLAESVCVQGAPGTGKTAVGLHRVAFLLYTHRDRLKRGGALVVGPNRQFLKYIEQVLPALGEVDVAQATVEELVFPRDSRFAVRGLDSPSAARLKGDARMAEVLYRALWSHLSEPTEALVVPRGSRIWRIPAYEIAEQVAAIRERNVRYAAGRAMLAQRIAHAVLTRMEAAGESPDDRVQDAVARSRPVKAVVDQIWPAVDPVKLLFALLSSAERLARAAAGLLTDGEQAEICWEGAGKVPRTPSAARWTPADAVLLDELADQIDRTPSLAHVVLDEAQDLSPMQCRAVGRRCATGSATVLGDVAQATTAWAAGTWNETLRHLGKPGAVREELTQGFRVPKQVIEYAARLLPVTAPHLAPPTSVRQAEGALELCPVDDVAEALAIAAWEALAREGSIGVIAADAALPALSKSLRALDIAHAVLGAEEERETSGGGAERDTAGKDSAGTDIAGTNTAGEDGADDPAAARLILVPASLAKGLEYDQVIVTEPADIVEAEYTELLGLRRLYVVLTRAVSRLTVLHARPLPAQLATA